MFRSRHDGATLKTSNTILELNSTRQPNPLKNITHLSKEFWFLSTSTIKNKLPDKKAPGLPFYTFQSIRLRTEDFESPDLLGDAYEYLIKQFADSAGKKGGEFYTPSEVVWLLVSLLKPTAGMKIYDPTAGSGGMLIQTRNYLIEQGETHRICLCMVRR